MNKLYNYISSLAVVLLTLTACYEDKGNYDYKDVNKVQVEMPETVVRLSRTGSVDFTVEPKLTQSMIQNENALEFRWFKGGKEAYLICENKEEDCDELMSDNHYHYYSSEKVFRMTLDASFSDFIRLLLEVTDKTTNTKYYQMHPVRVIKPFSNTWFVLQNENGIGKLGVADGVQKDALVSDDVYKSEFASSFPMQGVPQGIESRHFYGLEYYMSVPNMIPVEPMLIIRTDKDFSLVRPTTLETKYSIADMIMGGKVDGATNWNPKLYICSHYGEVVYDQGKLWHSLMDGFAVYYRILDTDGKQVDAPWVADLGMSFLIFDEKNRCFKKYSYNTMDNFYLTYYLTGLLRKMPAAWEGYAGGGAKTAYPLESENELFNPNQVGEEYKMCAMISSGSRVYAVASTGGSAMTVFEISEVDGDPCTGLFQFSLPETTADQCKFITAHAYDRIFFFAAGNALYKVDLNRPTPAVSKIYEHDNAEAKIDALKFKERTVPYDWDTENIMNKYQMQLGLGVNFPDGTASVVELNLTSAGDVNRVEGSIYEYKGFKSIVDIAYNYGDE